MSAILRQIVAAPRVRHVDTGLDLCYVTDNIVVTSGPSQTYPRKAYRNPLDKLVAFLDSRHGEEWAIWEFRAEGTGYPDEAVYGRVHHFPWPDHHPPPFRVVPVIMGGMRMWLEGGELEIVKNASQGEGIEGGGVVDEDGPGEGNGDVKEPEKKALDKDENGTEGTKARRLAVLHCKAGKGRSGSMTVAYLISECGYTLPDAMKRFTEKRMLSGFGQGVSIPSQVRYVGYVERWAREMGKRYVDRRVEVLEVRCWGLRAGVSIEVEGFQEEGRRIGVFCEFGGGSGRAVAGGESGKGKNGGGNGKGDGNGKDDGYANGDGIGGARPTNRLLRRGTVDWMEKLSRSNSTKSLNKLNDAFSSPSTTSIVPPASMLPSRVATPKLVPDSSSSASPSINTAAATTVSSLPTPATTAAAPGSSSTIDTTTPTTETTSPTSPLTIFTPATPIVLPTSDINISLERRALSSPISSLSTAAFPLPVTTSIAHFWFNVFFEGTRLPPAPAQQEDKEGVTLEMQDEGIYEIDWEEMDGVKGTRRKGVRAVERVGVVWRVHHEPVGAAASVKPEDESSKTDEAKAEEEEGELILEPGKGDHITEPHAADWRGVKSEKVDPDGDRELSAGEKGKEKEKELETWEMDPLSMVRSVGPWGEELGGTAAGTADDDARAGKGGGD